MQHGKQNPNEMLQDNLQEANYHRERKTYERNERLKGEQEGLDRLNRQIADEERLRNSRKAQLRNEQFQEYSNYQKQKYEVNPGQKRSKDELTTKIGGEERYIKRKTYDEVSNGLCLNPTRDFTTLGRPEMNQMPQQQQTPTQKRDRSHGYNIISNQIFNESSKYQTGASIHQARGEPMQRQPDNQNYKPIDYSQYDQRQQQQQLPPQYEPRQQVPSQYEPRQPMPNYAEQQSQEDYYREQMNNHNLERLQPLPQKNEQAQPEKEPELTEEDYKRYYEYLNSLEKNQGLSKENERGGTTYEYQDSKSNQPQQQYQEADPYKRNGDPYGDYPQAQEQQYPSSSRDPVDSLTSQMHQMNLQNEVKSEYQANKQKNRSSFSNFTDGSQPSSQPVQNQQATNNPNSFKMDQQRMYRELLDNQVKAKDVYKKTLDDLNNHGSSSLHQNQDNQPNQVPISQPTQQELLQANPYKAMRNKNSKFNEIPSNPYSNKNYNFGSSALTSGNPITNPVSSYKFQSQMSNDNNRQVASGRLRNLGSNIINQ